MTRTFLLVSYSLLALFLLSGCFKKRDNQKFEEYDGPMLVNYDVELLYTDSARTRIKVKAKEQYQLKNEDFEFPKGLHLEFYDEFEKLEATLDANYGYFNKEENEWTVKDKVVLKNIPKNQQLSTEVLNWSPPKREVKTDAFVTIRDSNGDILQGRNLVAKDDFSEYEILNPTFEGEGK